MKAKTKILYLIFVTIILILSSCKLRHVNHGVKETLNTRKLLELINDNMLKYDNLSYNFSAEISSGEKSQSFSGIVRVIHDSVIWISLRSLSIEGARIFIDKDSLTFLNRLEKQYLKESTKDLQAKFGTDLDINVLESVISNKLFLYPEPEDSEKAISKLKLSVDSSLYNLSSISDYKFNKYYIKNKRDGKWNKKLEKEKLESRDSLGDFLFHEANDCVFQRVKVLPDIFKVSEMLIVNYVLEQSFCIKYYNFIKNGNNYFPSRIDVEILTSKFDISLSLKIESFKINSEKLNCPIKIPSKYNKNKI